MKETVNLKICEGCIHKIICDENPTEMCNAYRILMAMRGGKHNDG